MYSAYNEQKTLIRYAIQIPRYTVRAHRNPSTSHVDVAFLSAIDM